MPPHRSYQEMAHMLLIVSKKTQNTERCNQTSGKMLLSTPRDTTG